MHYFQHRVFGLGTSDGIPFLEDGQMLIAVNFFDRQRTFAYPSTIEQGILTEIDPPTVATDTTAHTPIDRETLFNLLDRYISDFSVKQSLPFVVNPSIPVVWFGDIEAYQNSPKRVLTVALNPSNKEFPMPPEAPRFDNLDLAAPDSSEKLYTTLNRYFSVNPYSWFEKYNRLMGVLDCSYGGQYGIRSNTAIHIDICTAIATNPVIGLLPPQSISLIQSTHLFSALFELLDPDIILISVSRALFEEHFQNWLLTHEFQFAGPNQIKGYCKQGKRLIWGTNFHGVPFGGINEQAAKEKIKIIVDD